MSGPATLGRGTGLSDARLRRTGSPRRLFAILAAVALLTAAGWALLPERDRSLAGQRLTGARGPSCLRLVIAVDVSGSMAGYAGARDSALAQLLGWAGDNLRPDDEITVVDFAERSAVRLPVTTVDALRPADGAVAAAVRDSHTTYLGPVLDQVRAQPGGPCDRAVLLLSDGLLADLPATADRGRAVLTAHDVHDLELLAPGEDVEVPAQWSTTFPAAAPIRFDGHDADDTAVALGGAIAAITRQTLEER
ncbi:vWA domain-containing protein [Pseudonocardia sp. ICBG1034]|uniref:vWA domain-containing protein n=1 Tax=Pseudonocardia sp. ICBG1034 TaxID=2844381 RepID=UPI001CCB1018|nr:vWA domain-containing protein [Pseudonocardia sp. ICBG1034]